MDLLTAAEMREADRRTIEAIGIPALVLMELAGREIAEEARALYRDSVCGPVSRPESPGGGHAAPDLGGVDGRDRPRDGRPQSEGAGIRLSAGRWLILCGKGNNGGDGLVAARHLTEMGGQALVVYALPPSQLSGDAARQRDWAERLGIPAMVYGEREVPWRDYDGAIDALIGTGASGAPREPYASLIREANGSGLPIVAADLPSGLDADSGQAYETCIQAARTVALGACKLGLAVHPGAERAGRIRVAPIGIPASVIGGIGAKARLLTEETLRRRLRADPARPRAADTHKGTYGHVAVAAGSLRMSGAGLLAVTAALRSGSGLVTWAAPAALAERVIGAAPEALVQPLASSQDGDWSRVPAAELLAAVAGKQAAVFGPGMGRFPGDGGWMARLWREAAPPCVFDADALNMLAEFGPDKLPPRPAPAVLTPHPGEMGRLCGCTTAEVQRDRIGLARSFAVRHGAVLVLKGARTIVAAPDGEVFVNSTGNPGMATGGSGDVLAGLIGGLLAQGLSALQAAALGVYLHGRAGDEAAAARPAPASLIARDILERL